MRGRIAGLLDGGNRIALWRQCELTVLMDRRCVGGMGGGDGEGGGNSGGGEQDG